MSVQILEGDCRETLRSIASDSVDSCVTDPPYALVSIVKRFGSPNAAPARGNEAYMRASAGFMGKTWDTGETAFTAEFWAGVLRVLKPGAFVVAFGATRGYHRMACAIEDAGFEIRDSLCWLYGTGFPKSHSVSKGIDKAGAEREAAEWSGWGTALKPAFEPIVLARKPLIGTVAENVLKHGTGALNIDGCRVEATDPQLAEKYASVQNAGPRENSIYGSDPHVNGRWPANVIHDGSDEVVGAFPDARSSGSYDPGGDGSSRRGSGVTDFHCRDMPASMYADSGSAARFFYSAKASKADRAGSKHPTVKPITLMRWLTRLITPPGGTVLDPFAGSGTTGAACALEGFNAVLCEREAEYIADIKRRLGVSVKMPWEVMPAGFPWAAP